MFAVLGELEIDVLHCEGLDLRAGASFAEHALIGRRPTLQWTGDALEERRLDVAFFDQLNDPIIQANRLRQALRDHQALALVLGSGVHLGWFVITEIQETPLFSRPTGDPRALRCSLTLREYAGDPAKPLERPALQVDPFESVTGPVSSWTDPITAALTDAAKFAAQVQGYVTQAVDFAQFAVAVADDPASALGLAPQLLGALDTLGLPMTGLEELLGAAGATLDGAADIAAVCSDALGVLGYLSPLLGADLTSLNVAGRYSTIADYLGSFSGQWGTVAAPQASQWAGQAAVRSGP